MSTEATDPSLEEPPPLQPVFSEQNQTSANNIDTMCNILAKQQAANLNAFSENLANHLNKFLDRLEDSNKTNHTICSKAIAKNGDSQQPCTSFKAIATNGDVHSNKNKKHSTGAIALGKEEKHKNRRKRPLSNVSILDEPSSKRLKTNKNRENLDSPISSSEDEYNNEKENINEEAISLPDQEDMDLKIQQLTGESPENSASETRLFRADI